MSKLVNVKRPKIPMAPNPYPTDNPEDWEDIEVFKKKTGVTQNEIYRRLSLRHWWDGFVIKKNPFGRIEKGNVKHYNHHWLGI